MINPKPGDIVMVTTYVRIDETSIDGEGYWVSFAHNFVYSSAAITSLPKMSTEASQIINVLRNHPYLATWHLRQDLDLKEIPDPRFGRDAYSEAMRELLALGLIEELPDLGCRYRLVVPQAEKSGVQG